MMNYIWIGMLGFAVLIGAAAGEMEAVTRASFEAAKGAVTLALGLVGIMALWLGIMRVASEAGLMARIARLIRPVMVRLFPDVPAEHPAMSAMIMNIAANMLGLANAATPFGVKAMHELDRLNTRKDTATDAMCLFLAINTSNVTLLPLGVIGIRAAAGSSNPAIIIPSTLFATLVSTGIAILMAKGLSRLPIFSRSRPAAPPAVERATSDTGVTADSVAPSGSPASEQLTSPAWLRSLLFWFALSAAGAMLGYHVALRVAYEPPLAVLSSVASYWLVPLLMLALLGYGLARGVRVYDALVAGAKEGFDVALRIIPYLVAIMVAVAMFNASGALWGIQTFLDPVLGPLGLPAEGLAMALVRPLSGSGAMGVMSEVIRTNGPDSYLGYLVSTINGSMETTFYVMAVYFGAVGVTRVRHYLWVALTADLAGVVAAVFICRLLFT